MKIFNTSIRVSSLHVQCNTVLVPETVIVIIPGPELGVVLVISLHHHNIIVSVKTNTKVIQEAKIQLYKIKLFANWNYTLPLDSKIHFPESIQLILTNNCNWMILPTSNKKIKHLIFWGRMSQPPQLTENATLSLEWVDNMCSVQVYSVFVIVIHCHWMEVVM